MSIMDELLNNPTLFYEGRRSVIYHGVSKELSKQVLVKVLKSPFPSVEEISRFNNEYYYTKDLAGSGIRKVYSCQKMGGKHILTLEYFQANTLQKALVGRIGDDIALFLKIAIKIAEVLDEVHKHGIIHKDINSNNILVDTETGEIKLIDFEIATQTTLKAQHFDTKGHLEGTLAYISPEQTGRMNRVVDSRSDLYSLGITLYELAAGELPFKADDPMEMIHCHIAKKAASLNLINPAVPQILTDIVAKLMEKNAEDRYQTARGLKADMEECLARLKSGNISEAFPLAASDFSGLLQIPEKLFGRDAEMLVLQNAFTDCATGAKPFFMLSGDPGTGKSALAGELKKAVSVKNGLLISGKFSEFQRNTPYFAISKAFEELTASLLSESIEDSEQTKNDIMRHLGDNGGVLTEIMPGLADIIGEQQAVPALGVSEAKNRFLYVFANFVKAVATASRPLLLFIDDVQWADLGTLQLLGHIMADSDVKHLMLICSFRKNEMTKAHPFMIMAEEIGKSRAAAHEIHLKDLDVNGITQMLSETFKSDAYQAKPLAQAVWEKTRGNAFFINQFLKKLYEDGHISFSHRSKLWQWNVDKIKGLSVTENVAELLAEKVNKMPPESQKVLQAASCIGSVFDMAILGQVFEGALKDVLACMISAVAEGLLMPLSPANAKHLPEGDADSWGEQKSEYKFTHDYVRSAVYSMMPKQQKEAVHFSIGKKLYQKHKNGTQEEYVFDMANQINLGIASIPASEALDVYIKINIAAGDKAVKGAAFHPAFGYFENAIALMEKSKTGTPPEEKAVLLLKAAQTGYLTGNFGNAFSYIGQTMEMADRLSQKVLVKAYQINIEMFIAQNRPEEAVEFAIFALHKLGDLMPEKPGQMHIILGLLKTKIALMGKKTNAFADLPDMTDENKLAIMGILSSAGSAIYFASPNHLPLMVFKKVQFSVKYGIAELSPYAFAAFGLILCGVLGDMAEGVKYGELALNLLETGRFAKAEARTREIVHGFIYHWDRPIAKTVLPLLEAYTIGLENGDLEFAALSGYLHVFHSFAAGADLQELHIKAKSFRETVVKLKQQTALNFLEICMESITVFVEEGKSAKELSGDCYREAERLPLHLKAKDKSALATLYAHKLQLSVFFGETENATELNALAEKYLEGVVSMITVPMIAFYGALALLMDPQNDGWKKKAGTAISKLKTWGRSSPLNNDHRYLLLEAEKHRRSGNAAKAREKYDLAIAAAKKSGFIHEEALCNERSGQYCLDLGLPHAAWGYLQNAYWAYGQWGGTAKFKHFENRYKAWIHINLGRGGEGASDIKSTSVATVVSRTASGSFDIQTLVKANQTLAGEIVLEKLTEKMMRIVMENAGAEKGALLLFEDGGFVLEAFIEAENTGFRLGIRFDQMEKHPQFLLSKPAALFAAKKKQNLILHKASQEGLFVNDEHVKAHKVMSLMCAPLVSKGEVIGLLYLENNLSHSVFTESRVELIAVLSSQLAIYIENALVYENLEKKVKARTKEVSEQKEQVIKQIKATEHAYENIKLLSALGKEVNSSLDLDYIGQKVYDSISSLMNAESFGIGVYDADVHSLSFVCYIEKGEFMKPFHIDMANKNQLSVWAIENHSEVFIGDYTEEHTKYGIVPGKHVVFGDHTQSLIFLPLSAKGETVGLITVQSYQKNAFSKNQLDLLHSLGSYIASALVNAESYHKIEDQKLEIEKKNHDITSSINYAKRIQDSMLPEEAKVKELLPDSFILFKPRDIVSGDFYWVGARARKTVVAVVDCTGHGVPGAFMSMIGNNFISEIVNEKKITSPDMILATLDYMVRKALKQDTSNNKDGMDASICVIDEGTASVEFSGANNPLIMMQHGRMSTIKANKFCIGGGISLYGEKTFTKTSITVDTPMHFYLFSDGYPDQFGGPEGRKFMIRNFRELLEEINPLSMREQKKKLDTSIESWMAYGKQHRQIDDILVIGFKLDFGDRHAGEEYSD